MNQSSLLGLPRDRSTKTRDVKEVPFVELLDQRLQGVVSSGSDIKRVYVSYFEASTLNFGCSTNNNRPCGGLRRHPCNHLRELMREAVIQFGIAHVVQFLHPDGDPAQFIDADDLVTHAGHINPQFAGNIFSRFLSDLELLELPVYNIPLTSMTWFAEFIDGTPDFAPFDLNDLLLQLSMYLSRIHAVDGSTVDLSFLPRQDAIYTEKFKQRPVKVDDSLDEGRIRDTLASVCPLTQHNKSVLLHGDFWVGNTLWKEGQLVGVIDWEDAKVGDPLADLANSRLEILWAFGIEAMSRFTQQYYQAMPHLDFTNLPYWDLCAALRPAFKISEWAADATAEKAMRYGHRLFITQAFAKLTTEAQPWVQRRTQREIKRRNG